MKGRGETSPIGLVIVGLFMLHWFSAVFGWDYFEDFFEDFPFFPLLFGFVLFRIFSALTEKNKRGPVPMPKPKAPAQEQPKDLGFKIPPLKGAPKEARAEAQTEEPMTDDELDILRRDSYERHLAEKQEREQKMEEERLLREHQMRETQKAASETLRFSPDALRNAVIWSEIIAPPKALRKRR